MTIETTAVTIRSLDPAVGIETLTVDLPCNPQTRLAYQLRRCAAVNLSRRNNLVPFGVCETDGSTDLLLLNRHRGTTRRPLRFGFLSFLHAGILAGDNNFATVPLNILFMS